MIITISGDPGSGKSTVAKILEKRLNAKRIYIGGIMRELAREKNMTVEQLMDYAKSHPEIDREADEKTRDEARDLEKQQKTVLVEGRIQFHFIPESFKIFISVNPEEAAKRIWKELQDKEANLSRNQDKVNSVEELAEKNQRRQNTDAERLLKLYGIDLREKSNYDFVLDTTNITAKEAADKIIKELPK